MIKFCIFILIAMSYASAETSLKVFPCKNIKPIATIKKLTISDCNAYPCVLKRGFNSSINVEFSNKQSISNLKLKITGQLNNKEVPFLTTNDDHCLDTIKDLKDVKGKKSCNLARNKSYNYTYALPVKTEYPTVSVIVQYHVMFGAKSVFCFTFPGKLV